MAGEVDYAGDQEKDSPQQSLKLWIDRGSQAAGISFLKAKILPS
jgi:hypothetical protein